MKAYLHIGAPNTGTTAVQHCFSKGRDALAAKGVLYPLTPGQDEHAGLAVYGADFSDFTQRMFPALANVEALEIERRRFAADLREELSNTACSTVFFSSAHLYEQVTTSHAMQRLRDLLQATFSELHLLVYLQRQDQYLAMAYAERLALGYSGSVDDFLELASVKRLGDYYANLRRWQETFADATLHVRSYGSYPFDEAIADACELVGVRPEPSMERATAAPKDGLRASVGVEGVTFLRRFNQTLERASQKPGIRQELDPLSRETLMRSVRSLDRTPEFQLEARLAERLLEEFQTGNAELVRRFGMKAFPALEKRGVVPKLFDRSPTGKLTSKRAIDLAAHAWLATRSDLRQALTLTQCTIDRWAGKIDLRGIVTGAPKVTRIEVSTAGARGQTTIKPPRFRAGPRQDHARWRVRLELSRIDGDELAVVSAFQERREIARVEVPFASLVDVTPAKLAVSKLVATDGETQFSLRGWYAGALNEPNVRVYCLDEELGAAEVGIDRNDLATEAPWLPSYDLGWQFEGHLPSRLARGAALVVRLFDGTTELLATAVPVDVDPRPKLDARTLNAKLGARKLSLRYERFRELARLKRKAIIFPHIHKTAGGTVDEALKRELGDGFVQVRTLPDRERVAQLAATGFFDDEKTYALSGHSAFGIESVLPDDLPTLAFTFLREPYDRFISWASYNRLRQLRLDDTVADFVAGYPENPYCHFCKTSDFEAAIETFLTYFHFVGTRETMQESLSLIHHACGFRHHQYAKAHVLDQGDRMELPLELLADLQTRIGQDLMLYAAVAFVNRRHLDQYRSEVPNPTPIEFVMADHSLVKRTPLEFDLERNNDAPSLFLTGREISREDFERAMPYFDKAVKLWPGIAAQVAPILREHDAPRAARWLSRVIDALEASSDSEFVKLRGRLQLLRRECES